MKVLAWLAFPLVATLLAMCWAGWRGRTRGPRKSGGAFASVDDFRRFNEAIAAPGPRATPERRRGLNRKDPDRKDLDRTDPNRTDPNRSGATQSTKSAGQGS
jgi:hypothetical protein